MSPRWGFKTFGFPVCYKHVAPLGLKTGNTRPLYIRRSAGAKDGRGHCSMQPKYVLDPDDDAEA